ncbi:MAG: Fe(3+) ABC transporter substrate-binding protein [Pseudomonadales bacterium]
MSRRFLLPALLLSLAACDNGAPPATTDAATASSADPGAVNVYSSRHYDTDMRLYEQFTENTGITVNLIEGKSDALIERIRSEGEFSPADMLITVDAGTLWRAEQAGVFAAVESDVLAQRVPANLRSERNQWFGLSKRARVIVHNDSIEPGTGLDQYEDLSDPAHKGKVCMRSSSNIYNLSLLGSLIEQLGSDAASSWAQGVADNFARAPQGNDTAQLKAVAAGECAITIANSYYLGRLLGSENAEDQAVVAALTVVFPNQGDRGTHVNISGAGVTKHAPNRANAIAFLEYLTSDFAQKLFAEGNNEYPVQGAATGPVAALGSFAEDQVRASSYGERQAEAVQIFDRVGWQ